MATYGTNELKNGLKIMMDNAPCTILDCEFIKPGKGQAFTRIKIRNVKTGRVVERTLKSNETIESADVVDTEMQYLYRDDALWYFMTPEDFEQYAIPTNILATAALWIKEQDLCVVTLWNNEPIQVIPPIFVTLKITETDPGVRGDTSGGGGKPAKLETGATVRVPLFVQEGEYIKVDTRTAEYVARVKV